MSLLFADNMVLLASLVHVFWCALRGFTDKCEEARVRVITSKSKSMVLSCKTMDCPLWVGGELLPWANKFEHLRLLLTSDEKMKCEMAAGLLEMYFTVMLEP